MALKWKSQQGEKPPTTFPYKVLVTTLVDYKGSWEANSTQQQVHGFILMTFFSSSSVVNKFHGDRTDLQKVGKTGDE